MADDKSYSGQNTEEIEGAPAVESSAEIRERRLASTICVNQYLYSQSQQMQLMLMEATDLQALLEVLLVSMPRHFGFRVTELWLYDPENVLAGLISGAQRYGSQLLLHHDAFEMQELYDLEPDIAVIDATDSRMFEVLKSDQGIDYALLMPLMDSGRLMGSYHCGMTETSIAEGRSEQDVIAHLASVISICFKNAVSRQQVSQLTMLDPLTHISNLRGFEKDIAREIARARRGDVPVTVLMMVIDEYEDLYAHYGKVTGQFVMKKVAERVSSGLRETDYMARLSDSDLAVLIPASSEALGQDIAERMRVDIDDFAIDDGRGAILHVTLSIGVVTWEPRHFPAVDMAQLAKQLESEASKAVQAAAGGGGNSIVIGRLGTLMV
ncbi:MAG: diguanylate cyclase (GGDEF)-like protein [Alcanivorax sp.]|jgi:diguanylate cyclase (GGDEF)-like protein